MLKQQPITEPERELARALARSLRAAGAPAHRVEDRMAEFARATGSDVRFHVLPAAIFAASGPGTTVIDVAPGPPDLDRMCAVEELAERVASGTLRPADALAAVRARDAAPGIYSPGATWMSFALASASAVTFFGGGPIEAIAAAAVGAISGLLTLAMSSRPHASHLVEVTAAAVGAFFLHGLARLVPLSGEIALITGLIVLLPGFTLTTALTELATRHRVSGTAGLASGALILLELGFGVALGSQLADAVIGPTAWTEPALAFPPGFELPAVAGVALSFGVLLQARPIHLPQVLAACVLALSAQDLGATLLGPELAGGVASFAIALAANAMSRRFEQPAAVWQLPGILLLVPGSIGFRSVTALLDNDVMTGVDGAFGTALACMALVGGSLLGSALVPPRRAL